MGNLFDTTKDAGLFCQKCGEQTLHKKGENSGCLIFVIALGICTAGVGLLLLPIAIICFFLPKQAVCQKCGTSWMAKWNEG